MKGSYNALIPCSRRGIIGYKYKKKDPPPPPDLGDDGGLFFTVAICLRCRYNLFGTHASVAYELFAFAPSQRRLNERR